MPARPTSSQNHKLSGQEMHKERERDLKPKKLPVLIKGEALSYIIQQAK